MKVGDKVDVVIGSHTVAQATVKESGDGTVTLIVPATKVVMGVKSHHELTDLPSTEPEKQTVIDGVDRPSATVNGTVNGPANENITSINAGTITDNTLTADKITTEQPNSVSETTENKTEAPAPVENSGPSND